MLGRMCAMRGARCTRVWCRDRARGRNDDNAVINTWDARPMQEMMHRYRHAGKKLQQLLRMEPSEIVFRGRQEIVKRLERIGVIGNLDSLSGPDKLSPGIGPDGIFNQTRKDNFRTTKACFDRFWETAPSRFFEGPVSPRTPTILEGRMPGLRKQIIARAEDIGRGYFDLLGYSQLFFGNPVDWHLDAVSGRQAPTVHWSRIDPLDPEMVGDSKVIWELNRHQWLLDLGQA